MTDIRFLAEWESTEAILMALPNKHTDWEYMLDEIREQYRIIIEAFTKAGERVILLTDDIEDAKALLCDACKENLLILKADYNDTWTRDYGPLCVIRDGRMRALDFGFNGWGLKFASDKDNLVNLNLANLHVINPSAYRNHRDFTLEGGSVESDGNGTILTTSRCLCSPNRNGGLDKQQANQRLKESLGAEHVLWLDYGALAGDDTDSHIDTLARICPNDIILFTGCRDVDDEHFESLLKMRAQLSMLRNMQGEPYNLVELPLPPAQFDEEGNRIPATYANYLVTKHNIFMPVYGDPNSDNLACQTVRIPFPDKNIIPIDCRALLKQHGSLHCATMQIPSGILNSCLFL